MLEIWDEQTGALLADGLEDMAEARERLEELLTATRRAVQTSGDDVEGMWLEWSIRDRTGPGLFQSRGRSASALVTQAREGRAVG